MPSALYLTIAIVLTGFGFIGMASIGLPFLLLGLSLLFAYPIRDRRAILLTILFGELAFFLAAALVAPWGCRAEIGLAPESSTFTTCDNPLGITYQGEGLYNPSLWPAIVVGVVTGIAVSWLVYRRVAAVRPQRPALEEPSSS